MEQLLTYDMMPFALCITMIAGPQRDRLALILKSGGVGSFDKGGQMQNAASQGDVMFKHILIATDGSELATKALHAGLGLAKCLGAKVAAVAITEPRTNLMPDKTVKSAQADEYDAALVNAALAVLTNAEAEASKLGVACSTVHIANEFPAEGILKEAKARECDVIVWRRTDEEDWRDCCSAARHCGW